MVDEANKVEEHRSKPALKVVEPEIDPNNIWADDKLERKRIADRLTTIVKDQEAPFVISLDGRWGTGKTFLLKRWQAQLERGGHQAIYFNAWEDDFCDDPLLAIIGQLTEHFQEGRLREMAAIIGDIALPILTGKLTGVAFTRKDLKRDNLLNDYRTQLRTKREIRNHLARLAKVVKEESGKPLVFIIDELDRCRPTFAIELLERVKHIFDVPNIVFVFGINRTELLKSLESVYGQIDAGVYLRRFFDMEFVLPDADPIKFCAHLVEAYGLTSFFSDLSKSHGSPFHTQELASLSKALPVTLGRLGLALRDMDHCVRSVALVGRGLQKGYTTFPEVLAVLVAVKITEPDLYRRFVTEKARGAELVDHINALRKVTGHEPRLPGMDEKWQRDYVEAVMYCADDGMVAMEQLRRLQANGKREDPENVEEMLTQPEYLAKETIELDATSEFGQKRLANMIRVLECFVRKDLDYGISVPYLAELIDLHVRDSGQ